MKGKTSFYTYARGRDDSRGKANRGGARHLRRRDARLGGYRLFGGDAARQRAELYARPRRWDVLTMDQVDPRKFGLDLWGRDETTGIQYSHVAMRHAGPRWFTAARTEGEDE